ncbi:MAG: heme-binding protein [Anaerolineae bacterium]|nr:heme-binding protein [Anaerolineae bacterium]MDQ7037186.1 heme-binding protein [Anaerolineae bacterium]
MNTKFTLSHTEAMTIIKAIRERAEAENVGLAAAVVDEHGELIAFLRTDGCRLPSIQIAQNKAYTAVREQIESKELGNRAQSLQDGFPMTNFGELRYVTWGGGVPIRYQGQVVGAVGVSGLPESVDIDYAKHGVAALLA